MAVDYEAAWDELQERILQRDGWGSRTLVAEMADLRIKHKIQEGLLARALRIASAAANGLVSHRGSSTAPDGRPTADPEEDHDGTSSNGRSRAGAASGHA